MSLDQTDQDFDATLVIDQDFDAKDKEPCLDLGQYVPQDTAQNLNVPTHDDE